MKRRENRVWSEEEIEEAIRAVRGTVAMSGFQHTAEGEELIKRSLRQEISQEEFLRLARELAEKG